DVCSSDLARAASACRGEQGKRAAQSSNAARFPCANPLAPATANIRLQCVGGLAERKHCLLDLLRGRGGGLTSFCYVRQSFGNLLDSRRLLPHGGRNLACVVDARAQHAEQVFHAGRRLVQGASALLRAGYGFPDALGGFTALLGQATDLRGDYGKTTSVLA